jgi:hypothetical protein
MERKFLEDLKGKVISLRVWHSPFDWFDEGMYNEDDPFEVINECLLLDTDEDCILVYMCNPRYTIFRKIYYSDLHEVIYDEYKNWDSEEENVCMMIERESESNYL